MTGRLQSYRTLTFLLAGTLFGCATLPPSTAEARRKRKSKSHASRPLPLFKSDGSPNIQAQAAVVMDLDTGKDLYVKHADAVRPIASISKLMAALVVLEKGLDLDAQQTILEADRKAASRGAKSRLIVGMTFSNRDLLHAALMSSDNRATIALGRSVGLTPAQLASAMSAKAKTLGLAHTTFDDPTGLDDDNVSTPREVVRLLRAALGHPLLSAILKTWQYTLHPLPSATNRQTAPIALVNTDRLLRGGGRITVLGGKTGYTDVARYCLVVAATVGGRRVGMAFLGAEGKLTRFADFNRSVEWLIRKPRVAATAPGSSSDDKGPVSLR